MDIAVIIPGCSWFSPVVTRIQVNEALTSSLRSFI